MKRYPSVILATCVVPWRADYSLDDELFRSQVRLLRDQLTRHLYVFGTAGEGYAVSDRQFEQIVRAFYAEMRGPDDHPMIGIISLSLPTVVDRIAWCASLGLRNFQISLPSWGALTDREVDAFFAETCGRFPDCRFLHYNLGRTKRVLTGADYARLAAAHTNLVAVKFGADDQDARLDMLRRAPDLQFFWGESGYVATRDQFECGLLVSTAAVSIDLTKTLFAAQGARLQELFGDVDHIGQALHRAVGTAGHMDGVFDKLIIKVSLPDFPLRLLPPYSSADDGCLRAFVADLPPRLRPAWSMTS